MKHYRFDHTVMNRKNFTIQNMYKTNHENVWLTSCSTECFHCEIMAKLKMKCEYWNQWAQEELVHSLFEMEFIRRTKLIPQKFTTKYIVSTHRNKYRFVYLSHGRKKKRKKKARKKGNRVTVNLVLLYKTAENWNIKVASDVGFLSHVIMCALVWSVLFFWFKRNDSPIF